MAQVKTFGEAVGILVQVAQLAQSKGILSLQEAVIVAESLQRVDEFKAQVEAGVSARSSQQPAETPAADVAQG